MNLSDLTSRLSTLLPAHLARQRWYGAKGRVDAVPEFTDVEELRAPWPGLVRAVVSVQGHAGPERYQLLVGLRPVDQAGPAAVGETAAVGVVETEFGAAFCFDALVDSELGMHLLAHVAPAHEAADVRPIGAEQSNSSLVYDERLILKVFRRLSGSNPEIEVTLALAQRGFSHVAEPLAVWRQNGDDLAVLQRFLAGGTEGWALALTSIRDLLDECVPPSEAGGDLAPEAERLGVMTAELHVAMADAFGTGPGVPGEWADAASARLASVEHPELDRALLSARFDRAREIADAGSSIRIHGDYHLGQVMRTDEGWFVLDFEGEPARPVEERRRPSSPLRDVAGMLRSLDYASAVGLRDAVSIGPGLERPPATLPGATEPVSSLSREELAGAWQQRNREAFLTAYLATLEGSPLLPHDMSATNDLLALFELDKAVYEVAYEQAHRPDWVQIPLDAVRRLTEKG